MKHQQLLQFAGYLHFAILTASVLVPKGLNWKTNLAPLPPMLRSMFWVYGIFIVFIIIAFGTVTLVHLDRFLTPDPLGRAMCAIIALFWTLRLLVQLFVFDARPFLTNWFYKTGYHSLTLVFIYFVLVYGWTAFAR